MSGADIWPHARGSHRGDRRSPGRGAIGGVVRWRWRADVGVALHAPLLAYGDELVAVE